MSRPRSGGSAGDRRPIEHTHSAPDPPNWKARQAVLNESWPPPAIARTTPDRDPIDVTVRLVLDRDGERWMDARADRWHGQHVYVTIEGPQITKYGSGVWLHASDVRRR